VREGSAAVGSGGREKRVFTIGRDSAARRVLVLVFGVARESCILSSVSSIGASRRVCARALHTTEKPHLVLRLLLYLFAALLLLLKPRWLLVV